VGTTYFMIFIALVASYVLTNWATSRSSPAWGSGAGRAPSTAPFNTAATATSTRRKPTSCRCTRTRRSDHVLDAEVEGGRAHERLSQHPPLASTCGPIGVQALHEESLDPSRGDGRGTVGLTLVCGARRRVRTAGARQGSRRTGGSGRGPWRSVASLARRVRGRGGRGRRGPTAR